MSEILHFWELSWPDSDYPSKISTDSPKENFQGSTGDPKQGKFVKFRLSGSSRGQIPIPRQKSVPTARKRASGEPGGPQTGEICEISPFWELSWPESASPRKIRTSRLRAPEELGGCKVGTFVKFSLSGSSHGQNLLPCKKKLPTG